MKMRERGGSEAELVSITTSTAFTTTVEALLRLLLLSEPPPGEAAAAVTTGSFHRCYQCADREMPYECKFSSDLETSMGLVQHEGGPCDILRCS
ncbi:hypothetical protein Ahy_A06g029966 [Arachis hypogaea]|uniref:Uncharacterized protein n=1 Tax=Arachis hypogaea TaxID=3818 RepID=A0A445CUS2_ARAHY|nr:hypothetical protein Ahy_A06g029966 [Arachis hypogaea]